MEPGNLNSKIREIISFYNLSDRQFSLKIGVNPSVIGSMFQKGTEPSSKIIRNTLLNFPELSADWFLRDIGTMLKSNDKSIERVDKLIGTIETLQESIEIKNGTISALQERIKQLENQLKKVSL